MEIIGRNQRERRIRFRDGALSYLCDICLLNVGLLNERGILRYCF